MISTQHVNKKTIDQIPLQIQGNGITILSIPMQLKKFLVDNITKTNSMVKNLNGVTIWLLEWEEWGWTGYTINHEFARWGSQGFGDVAKCIHTQIYSALIAELKIGSIPQKESPLLWLGSKIG